MKKIVVLLIFISGLILINGTSYAQSMSPRWEKCRPAYGGYCCGYRWGWYGAKRLVSTSEEAREILVRFFAPYSGLKVGTIREKASFFEAEIIDRNGAMVDLVIVDKRTGRIRSIY